MMVRYATDSFMLEVRLTVNPSITFKITTEQNLFFYLGSKLQKITLFFIITIKIFFDKVIKNLHFYLVIISIIVSDDDSKIKIVCL